MGVAFNGWGAVGREVRLVEEDLLSVGVWVVGRRDVTRVRKKGWRERKGKRREQVEGREGGMEREGEREREREKATFGTFFFSLPYVSQWSALDCPDSAMTVSVRW